MTFIHVSCNASGSVILRINRLALTLANAIHISRQSPVLEKKQKKQVVIKRVIRGPLSKDTDESCILESKDASSVIKRLNWENSHLFGPVQSSKPEQYNERRVAESNRLIQHVTNIKVTYPESKLSYDDVDLPARVLKTDLNLSSILDFPMVNKFNKCAVSSHNENFNKMREFLVQKRCAAPSVSTILQKTMPKERVEILNKWKEKMVKELGEEGFKIYQERLLSTGSSLHSCLNSYLSTGTDAELQIDKTIQGFWTSVKPTLPCINNVKMLEEFTSHPFLHYRGIVDCFAMYRNHLVVIDWKTSQKAKHNIEFTYDSPLQIAAYVGALNFDPKYQYLANKGLLVIAYSSGSPATLHFIDENKMQYYWREWLKRVQLFWEMELEIKT